MLSLFSPPVELDPETGRPSDASPNCRCGRGWCKEHGTDHLSSEEEMVEEFLRQEFGSTRRLARLVIRKEIDD